MATRSIDRPNNHSAPASILLGNLCQSTIRVRSHELSRRGVGKRSPVFNKRCGRLVIESPWIPNNISRPQRFASV